MADALVSGTSGRKAIGVRLSSRAQEINYALWIAIIAVDQFITDTPISVFRHTYFIAKLKLNKQLINQNIN